MYEAYFYAIKRLADLIPSIANASRGCFLVGREEEVLILHNMHHVLAYQMQCFGAVRCCVLKQRSMVPIRHLTLMLPHTSRQEGRKQKPRVQPPEAPQLLWAREQARAIQSVLRVTIAPPASLPLPRWCMRPVALMLARIRGQARYPALL